MLSKVRYPEFFSVSRLVSNVKVSFCLRSFSLTNDVLYQKTMVVSATATATASAAATADDDDDG